jgi:hypothetical protein
MDDARRTKEVHEARILGAAKQRQEIRKLDRLPK